MIRLGQANDQRGIFLDQGGDRDIFVHDRDIDGAGIYDEPGSFSTFIVSNAVGGQGYANGSSAFPFTSASGRYVAFQSCAFNLANQDINNSCDVFVYDIQAQSTANPRWWMLDQNSSQWLSIG